LKAGKIDRSLLRGESCELFSAAIRSPATRDPYERKLLGFLKRVNLTPDEFAQFAKENPSAAEKKIISLLSQDRLKIERGEVTAGTINNWLKAVRLFLEMNDVAMNWKKIKRMLPMIRRYALDRVPRLEELREILDAADIRGKALTLVLVSSGIREGAVPSLRISDYNKLRTATPDAGSGGENLTSISNSSNNSVSNPSYHQLVAGKIIIYHDEPESYTAFISPEACIALDKYLDFRREHGEQINDSSPLFRDKFDPVEVLDNDKLDNNNDSNGSNYSEEVTFHTKGRSIKNEKNIHEGHTSHNTLVLPITEHSIRQYYNRLLRSIGIRKERKKRHEFSVHGFRKYFKTKSELAGVKPAAVEMLMGHSLGSVSDSYFKPSESELLIEYLKASDALSINATQKLKLEVERLEAGISELEDKNRRIEELERKQRQFELAFQTLIDSGMVKPLSPSPIR
jgi:integrase